MNDKQGRVSMGFFKQIWVIRVFFVSLLLLGHISVVKSQEVALQSVDFNALSGDNLQLSFDFNHQVVQPKVFTTDNPARIVLDFVGINSQLKQKKTIINAGGITSFVAIEAAGRLRIVVNLLKLVAYEVKLKGNRVVLTLRSSGRIVQDSHKNITEKTLIQFTSLIPKQEINKIDFRRGSKGEGRLLVSLSNPNTVVNTQEKGGKLELSFLNTELPQKYIKKMDVLDFATPVSMIEAKKVGSRVKIVMTPAGTDYDYSVFQSDGLLTVEIRPITTAAQEEKLKNKFPYTGERLSLNFQNIEIRSVLQILADFTDLNIIASDAVTGSVTLRLNDVPWDQALEFIMKAKGLSKRQAGNVILVAPTAEIRKLEEEEIESKKVVERLAKLKTEYMQINYSKAQNFRNIILGNSSMFSSGCSVSSGNRTRRGGSQNGSNLSNLNGSNNRGNANGSNSSSGNNNSALLSSRGSAIVDSRTNTLIIKDTAKNIEEIRKMIQVLDRPVRQVLIEARIVIAEEGFAQELGMKFGAAYTGGDFQTGGTAGSTTSIGGGGDVVTPILSNLAASNPYGALGMTLADGANYVLNLEITALQDERKAEFISNPRVLTSDRCKATIEQGEEIPYQTTSQNGTQTIFKSAKILLEVTPQITPSGSVIMQLHITKDARGSQTANGLAINKREINTSVQVENGETVVLGGVYEGNNTNIVNSVPWFSDLPVIGWMFRKNIDNKTKRELLIFITPKVIKSSMKMH